MSLLVLSTFSVLVVVILAWLLIFLRYRYHDQREYLLALEDTLKFGGAGVLIFDQKDKLKHSNEVAEQYFQTLRDRDVVLKLSDFIAYIFDHASEETASTSKYFAVRADFREIVLGDDGQSYLVEMHKLNKDRTIVLIRDISELKAQDDDLSALNEVNENLSLAIEATSCGVFILDAQDKKMPVIFSNRMCRSLADIEASFLPLPFSDLFKMLGKSNEDTDLLLKAIKQNQKSQPRDSFYKQVKFDKNGEKSWFDFRLTPVFDSQEKLHLYVGVLSDVTALKIKEGEFNRAQKLDSLGQLSAGIAHDFNNVLSIVEGYARMIEMNTNNVERIVEYAKKIQDSSARGAGLTKKMTAFARHKVAQDSVTDLKALLKEQEVLLKPVIDESIDFSIACDEQDLFGRCEADNFVQIIMNLVINARDALDGKGRLRVYLSAVDADELPEFVKKRASDYLCLRVWDNGSGMSKEVCERVFDPFYTTKEQGKGTGLGLSVIYGLVRDMEGYIDVRSELSVGSEFSVYIPRADTLPEECKSLKGDVEDIDTVSFKGFTALIVEDEDDLRDILVTFLEKHDMQVLAAENGNEALVLQDDHEGDIDVLITDLVMPGINGVKLAEMVKALRPDIQTVFMSGYPARGEDAKIDIPDDAFFMSKPPDFDGLCVSIFQMLDKDSTNVVPIDQKRIGDKT